MLEPEETERLREPSIPLRIGAAIAAALVCGLGVYLLLEIGRPESGLISFSFLLILPTALCAFVSYLADPLGERSLGQYLMVPVWVLLAIIVCSIFILREGTVCIVLLAPLWLLSGSAGAWITYKLRARTDNGTTYCLAWLGLPLLAMQIEPILPLTAATFTVSRTTIVNASAAKIWPLLEGIPDVQPSEGRWNISQDIVGIPRPIGASLHGVGPGAERRAKWTHGITFSEQVTDWEVNRRIRWRFVFRDIDQWRFTDRHLKPVGPYFQVRHGGYTLTPLGPDRARVTIDTTYWIKTPVNLYSAMWGELFLGDLENNLLALVKGRAERPRS